METVTTPATENPIENVHTSTYAHIKEYWGLKFFIPVTLLLLLAILISFVIQHPAPLIIGIIGVFYIIKIVRDKVHTKFMRQFAAEHALNYQAYGNLGERGGEIFSRGYNQAVTDFVYGTFNNHNVSFFNYTFTIGHGKGRTTYNYTVCEILLAGGMAPDIIVESRTDLDLTRYSSSHQREVPVESAFRDYFVVFAPEKLEIETLEIFTPDVMAHLIDHAQKYNFEFIGNRLNVFRSGTIINRAELIALFELSTYLMTTLGPRIFRLRDDVQAMQAVLSKS